MESLHNSHDALFMMALDFSTAVKEHHNQGKSYERKHLIGSLLIVSESSSTAVG